MIELGTHCIFLILNVLNALTCWQWLGQNISLLQLMFKITPCFLIQDLSRIIRYWPSLMISNNASCSMWFCTINVGYIACIIRKTDQLSNFCKGFGFANSKNKFFSILHTVRAIDSLINAMLIVLVSNKKISWICFLLFNIYDIINVSLINKSPGIKLDEINNGCLSAVTTLIGVTFFLLFLYVQGWALLPCSY